MQYIAPSACSTTGEFSRDRGRDALTIDYDLTRHAWAYRQVSLLPTNEDYLDDIDVDKI